jgi:hypothetical protein
VFYERRYLNDGFLHVRNGSVNGIAETYRLLKVFFTIYSLTLTKLSNDMFLFSFLFVIPIFFPLISDLDLATGII